MAVKRYDGSAWQTVAGLGAQGPAATSSSIATWVKTASGGETSLSGNDDNSQSLSYTVGQELVFINGTLLKRGSDYTATNGTSITGLTALAANDVATVWTVNAFSVTNAISNTLVDAKGDLIVATAADTPARLAVGSANQVLTVDSSTATGLKWATPASGGKVLQVVSSTATTWQGIKTASATDVTNMSVSITPSATSSKVLIVGMLNGVQSQTSSRERLDLRLVDGSNTSLYIIYSQSTFPNDTNNGQLNIPFTYLHSPNTTSAITYKLRVTNDTSAQGIYVNNFDTSSLTSSIVAMEIGA